HRPARPHALQPGLGPVRLSLQQRLRAVRAAPGGPRDGADRRRPADRRGPHRLVDRRRPLGRGVGSGPRMGSAQPASPDRDRRSCRVVDAPTWAIAIGVGVVSTLVARATLLPDVARWDTGEAQTIPFLLGTMHPTGFPAYVLLGWLVSHGLAP